MIRATFVGAAILAGVYFLVKMGAPGWFTLTMAAVGVGVLVLAVWPVLVIAATGWILWKWIGWKSRRGGARHWDGK